MGGLRRGWCGGGVRKGREKEGGKKGERKRKMDGNGVEGIIQGKGEGVKTHLGGALDVLGVCGPETGVFRAVLVLGVLRVVRGGHG